MISTPAGHRPFREQTTKGGVFFLDFPYISLFFNVSTFFFLKDNNMKVTNVYDDSKDVLYQVFSIWYTFRPVVKKIGHLIDLKKFEIYKN